MNVQQPLKSNFGASTDWADIMHNIDLSNRIAIVTGGYSGIGLETTKGLVSAGANVFIPAKRKEIAIENLNGIVPKENITTLDLSNLISVRSFTDWFKEKFNQLDILINNAGIMASPETRVGKNWESQFAINHIGHFLLTKELMNIMADTEGSR